MSTANWIVDMAVATSERRKKAKKSRSDWIKLAKKQKAAAVTEMCHTLVSEMINKAIEVKTKPNKRKTPDFDGNYGNDSKKKKKQETFATPSSSQKSKVKSNSNIYENFAKPIKPKPKILTKIKFFEEFQKTNPGPCLKHETETEAAQSCPTEGGVGKLKQRKKLYKSKKKIEPNTEATQPRIYKYFDLISKCNLTTRSHGNTIYSGGGGVKRKEIGS